MLGHTTESRRPKVLYVDDQVGNLTVFRANFRAVADIQTVTSGQEALQLLEVEEFPIVISDQRMDGISGSELLAQVRVKYPDSIRILLTAHSDFEAVISAINEGQIARFVRKPWDRDEMLSLLEESSRLYWKTRENRALTQLFVQQARLATIGQMTVGFAQDLAVAVERLDAAQSIRQQLGLSPGVSPEFDQLCLAIEDVRRVAQTLSIQAAGLLPREEAA